VSARSISHLPYGALIRVLHFWPLGEAQGIAPCDPIVRKLVIGIWRYKLQFFNYSRLFARLRSKNRPPRLVFRILGEPPLGQHSPKWEKLFLDSSRRGIRSITSLTSSAAEKSITVQTNKQTHSKLVFLTILSYGGIKKIKKTFLKTIGAIYQRQANKCQITKFSFQLGYFYF